MRHSKINAWSIDGCVIYERMCALPCRMYMMSFSTLLAKSLDKCAIIAKDSCLPAATEMDVLSPAKE